MLEHRHRRLVSRSQGADIPMDTTPPHGFLHIVGKPQEHPWPFHKQPRPRPNTCRSEHQELAKVATEALEAMAAKVAQVKVVMVALAVMAAMAAMGALVVMDQELRTCPHRKLG